MVYGGGMEDSNYQETIHQKELLEELYKVFLVRQEIGIGILQLFGLKPNL